MEAATIERLRERTGRSLEEWTAHLLAAGPAGTAQRAAWLKAEHGLGTNYARWIVERAERGPRQYDPAGMVERMFAGKKAALRPLYDSLLWAGVALGDDVTVTPCSTIVPLRRRYVFAQIKPSTLTRIDLGLALGRHGGELPKRVIDTGGLAKGDRITHRIAVSTAADIDDELRRWLARAYELDA